MSTRIGDADARAGLRHPQRRPRRAGTRGRVPAAGRLADHPRPHVGRGGDRVGSRAMFYDDDADLDLLDGKTVAILGYGSQGHAHALNLKDSGVDVIVGLREDSTSVEQAKAARASRSPTSPTPPARGDIVMVLLPDEQHHDVWEESIHDGIAPGNLLLFGHGFSIHYGEVEPPAGGRRRARRAEGPRPPRPPPVPRGLRRPRPDRRPPGRLRQRPATSRSPTPRASAARAAA